MLHRRCFEQPRLEIRGVVKKIASDVFTGAPAAKGYTVGPSVFGESLGLLRGDRVGLLRGDGG